jgi:hypothetical protein
MSRRARVRDERGYSLVELLLATFAGLIVSGAAIAIVISALDFSTNDPERVDANQQGATAMEAIVQRLDSSCVEGIGISPIVGATGGTGLTGSTAAPVSTGNSLTFYSSLSDAATLTPDEDVVYLSGGALYLATYPFSGGKYATTPSSTETLLAHAATATGATGVFSYYGYNNATGNLSTSPYGTPLGATNASTTSEIAISFQAQPSDGRDPLNAGVDLSNSVVLRMSAVSNIPPPTGSTTPLPCA